MINQANVLLSFRLVDDTVKLVDATRAYMKGEPTVPEGDCVVTKILELFWTAVVVMTEEAFVVNVPVPIVDAAVESLMDKALNDAVLLPLILNVHQQGYLQVATYQSLLHKNDILLNQ